MSEERSFRVGDLVSRDGTDIHRVTEVDDGYNCITVICVRAPASRWTAIGDSEFNLAGRYLHVRECPSLWPTMTPEEARGEPAAVLQLRATH